MTGAESFESSFQFELSLGGVVSHTRGVELLLLQVCDLFPLVVDFVVQGPRMLRLLCKQPA